MNGKHRRIIRLGLTTATLAGSIVALSTSAMAATPSSGGAFVIGDQNAAIGSVVTFWGAQWSKDNALSTGPAPASFKGFADNATATCGAPWSTRPGNSSAPPAEVSGVVPVVVSSHIDKSGDTISGDTAEVVLVKVDPGYGPDPGHPGTGTVVGVVCTTGGLPVSS